MSNTAALIALGLIAGAMVLVASSTPDEAALRRMSARFAPVEIAADINSLPAGEKRALAKLVEASRLMDALFLRQVWAGNESLFMELAAAASSGDPAARARLDYFLINKGPWSRLDHNQAFVAGVPEKPEAANFYPAGATKAEIEQWVATLPPAEKERAIGFFTTIRRTPPGSAQPFAIVPYSLEYQGELARAASLLREAAAATADASLKRFLDSRANAFLSNDYYESDLAWMELDSTIEPTIGPYEVYEDEWFNQKAAFEAFITVRDQAESEKLAQVLIGAAGHREPSADRSLAQEPRTGCPRTHPRRERGLHSRGRKPRRPDGRVQPPQRRTHHSREGIEARDAEEHAGGEVPRRARANCEGGAPAGGSGPSVVRCLLHAHPDARADARTWSAQYHRWRAARRRSARS